MSERLLPQYNYNAIRVTKASHLQVPHKMVICGEEKKNPQNLVSFTMVSVHRLALSVPVIYLHFSLSPPRLSLSLALPLGDVLIIKAKECL